MKKIIILLLVLTLYSCGKEKSVFDSEYKSDDIVINENKNNEYFKILEKAVIEEEKGNYKKAEKIYLEAEKYDKKVYLHIADMYLEQDMKKALEKYELAYEKGIKEAGLPIGKYYFIEKKDYKKAEEWYKKSISENNFLPYSNLAKLYNVLGKTEEVEKNYIEAANLKDATSMYELVKIYYLKKDKEKMRYWQEKLQNTEQIFLLSDEILESLKYSLSEKEEDKKFFELTIKTEDLMEKEKYEEAKKYFLEMEKLKPEGILYIADYYFRFENDKEMGYKKYIEAYEKGVAKATSYLAIIEHRNENFEEAKKWYEIASNNGFDDSQYYYAQLLEYENKEEEALKWYLVSAKNKNFKAIKEVLKFYYKEKNENKIKEWVDIVLNSKELKDYSPREKNEIDEYVKYLNKN